jgi:hypothetical protein
MSAKIFQYFEDNIDGICACEGKRRAGYEF